jgi:hypothetical protein
MIEWIKDLCTSKTNILAVSLSVFAFFKDMQELITGFASHLILVGITVATLVVMLIVNLTMAKVKTGSAIANNKDDAGEIIKTPNVTVTSQGDIKRTAGIWNKMLFSSALFISIMGIGSIVYIRDMDIFYVVLKNNLPYEDARIVNEKFNQTSEFINLGLESRFIPIGENNYEIILYNGYLTYEKAELDLIKVKQVKSTFRPYIVGPQKVTNPLKKIIYIQNDLFND